MNAIAYIRRSKESTEKTVSLDVQERAIIEYARKVGLDLTGMIVDDGVSGGDRERYEQIHTLCREKSARAVIVYHLDRFARDTEALLTQVRSLAKKGIDVHVVGKGRIDLTTSSSLLMTTVEAAIAEHYRALVSEKTRDALALRKAQGRRYSGLAPYGYEFDANGQLLPVEREQMVVCRTRELHRLGVSLRHIAHRLEEEGFRARNGNPFAPSTLAGLVKRTQDNHVEVMA
jgi:site-specific DNA recombinase